MVSMGNYIDSITSCFEYVFLSFENLARSMRLMRQIAQLILSKTMTATFDVHKHDDQLQSDGRVCVQSEQTIVASEVSLDPRDLAHLVIEGVFGLVFPDPHARLRMGLKAIGRARQESMAWYIWTTTRQGVFEVALLPGNPEFFPNGALFALRYFPDPNESIFVRFAPIEQQARLSPLFDHTGTPEEESAEQLDPSLFHIGSLSVVPSTENCIDLHLNAQNRWAEQVRCEENWKLRRNVPGLRLALAILDPLVCGLSYLGRRAPALVRTWHRPGLVWCIEPNGQAYSQLDPEASEWGIDLHGLLLPGCAGSCVPAPMPARVAGQYLFEHAADIPPRHAPWPVNSQWWQAAGWQFEPVGEFCSQCAAEHEGHIHHNPHNDLKGDDEHNT